MFPLRPLPLFALLAAACLAVASDTLSDATASDTSPPRAQVEVRALVIDPLGTRSVDTARARVPVGATGLLVRRVPYAGPPLSFRLRVKVGIPGTEGMPITMVSETWSGDTAGEPAEEAISRREETATLGPDSSYLMEIAHDPAADRRIVLSISARPASDAEDVPAVVPAPSGRAVSFLLEVIREQDGKVDPPDVQTLTSLVGLTVTYSSGVRLLAPGGDTQGEGFVGLSVVLKAEQVQDRLVSVGVTLSGAEFADAERRRLQPFEHLAVRTVPSGAAFDVSVEIPPGVRYQVRVTPSLAP
ncbi:MAG: hypothetical protein ACREAA_13505 [Candidatus Polarisedimenticolia bacterium]